jgi:excisionase family DNA binding protein
VSAETRNTSVTSSPITRTTPVEALPELLFVHEAAAWLGVGRSLIYELVKTGELPSVRLGRLVRVKRDGLVAMLKDGGA